MGAFKNFVVKNAPTILAGLAGVGTLATVVLTRKGTLKAEEELEEKRRELKGIDYDNFVKAMRMQKRGKNFEEIAEELGVDELYVDDILDEDVDPKEKLWIYAKAYGPAAVAATATLVCIFSSNRISAGRLATLAGAYVISENKHKELKKKLEEVYGKAKAQILDDEILEEEMKANPPTDENTVPVNENSSFKKDPLRLSLWYDRASGRYFYTNPDYIRRAELDAQEIVNKDGACSVNDVYPMIGLDEIEFGDLKGWRRHSDGTVDKVELTIGSMPDEFGNPIGTLTMNARPAEGEFFSAL